MSRHADDQVLEALVGVIDALTTCQHYLADALRGAAELQRARLAGATYSEILGAAEGPLVQELMAAVLRTLSDSGSRLRRASAQAMYAEGLSMEKIARLFGVSRQRVSSLLRPTAAAAPGRAAPPARRGVGLSLTGSELRMVAEMLPHIVWVAAPDGATEYLNTQGVDYTGRPRDANYGGDWVDLVHPGDKERARRAWAQAVDTEIPFELEYRIRRADGSYRWHVFHAVPARTPDGSVAAWIGTATDIDDLRTASSG